MLTREQVNEIRVRTTHQYLSRNEMDDVLDTLSASLAVVEVAAELRKNKDRLNDDCLGNTLERLLDEALYPFLATKPTMPDTHGGTV